MSYAHAPRMVFSKSLRLTQTKTANRKITSLFTRCRVFTTIPFASNCRSNRSCIIYGGEVEHKTIYKNREYDPTIANKKAFTEQIFNILQASDQQLHTLFDESYSEDKLMQAYFFQKTKDQIMKRSKTNILAEHYDRFFALFGDKTDKDYVDQYVKTAIQDKKFKRMAVDEITLSDKGIRLVREMEKTFYVYDLKMLYYIADILYQFKNYGHFLSYWAERLLKDYYLESESTVEEYDMFDEEEEETTATENTVVTEIIKILKNKIGRDRE